MPILHWLTRDEDIRTAQRVPYRLLEEVPDLSAGDGDADNMLIQGDNLEALKALLPFYAGRVKCIYIDPPYNTGAAFEHYDDNLENSIWLGTIWPRLELLRDLLAEDGSLWVNIDDRQGHYLKVILDEIFGRSRFVANLVWQKRTSRENRKAIGSAHDHILVYAPAGAQDWKKYRNLLPDNEKGYANPDDDPKGPWRSIPLVHKAFGPTRCIGSRRRRATCSIRRKGGAGAPPNLNSSVCVMSRSACIFRIMVAVARGSRSTSLRRAA